MKKNDLKYAEKYYYRYKLISVSCYLFSLFLVIYFIIESINNDGEYFNGEGRIIFCIPLIIFIFGVAFHIYSKYILKDTNQKQNKK